MQQDDTAAPTPPAGPTEDLIPLVVSDLVANLKRMRRAEQFIRDAGPTLRRLWPAGTHEIYRTGTYADDPLLMVNHEPETGLSFDLIDAPSINTVDSFPPEPVVTADTPDLTELAFFRGVNPDVPSPRRNGRPNHDA